MADTYEWIDTLLGNLPFVRIIYSLILLTLIVAFGRELLSVWGRPKIYLSDFVYFESGAKKAEYGEQIA